MSLDFDSAALQVPQDDEEYDQEDYAREQELKQLLTGLPHDMLEDSGDHMSDYSAPEDQDLVHEPWDQDTAGWDHLPVANRPQRDYEQGQNMYAEHFLYDQGNLQDQMCASDWPGHHNGGEDKSLLEISGRPSVDGLDDGVYLRGDGCQAPNHYPNVNAYHLPENFRPYTNGYQQEFSHQHGKITNTAETKKEPLKLQFGTSEAANNQSMEPYKVIYKPYQNNTQQPVPVSPKEGRQNEAFEELQQEFLATGKSPSENMQVLQLQVLNKAKERKLEELNQQVEEKAQQIRYLSHQVAMMKDEKDGMCLSLQESQKLLQNSKEKEVQLESQIKVLETQIQTLTAHEEQLIKQSKVAEVTMESLQQQLLELRRSDTLQRAREQHEAVVATLRQKYEEQVSSLQQKLDATNAALQEQAERCCHLSEHVKQLERMLEESKVEKTEIINRLSRSVEESQNQCANLLQTGLVKETHQLRMQLQQAQSAQLISSEMNKALQEELKELKEEIAVYESASKHGVFLNDPGGELNVEMTDSYAELGIKRVNKKTGLHSSVMNKDTDRGLCKDENIFDLKNEMERLLSSNKAKRNRVSQLQNDLENCHRTIEELKQQLVKTNSKELKGKNTELPSDTFQANSSEEIQRLKKENESLHQEIQSYNARVQELTESQEKLKHANQELCGQMRQLVQDSDRDKQEALDRCERTYRQHYDDMKKKLCQDFVETHAKEKEKFIQAYEENIGQLKANIDELNKEMMAVKECYVTVCREKDEQESTLKLAFEQEQRLKEEKFKKQLLEEKEEALKKLRTDLEEEFQSSMGRAKSQWQNEKEAEMKQRLDEEVAKVKAFWEKEVEETKDRAIQDMENECQRRLDQALAGAKRAAVELKEGCSQTEPLSIQDGFLRQLVAEAVEEQTKLFQQALKEKESALREHEAKHRENIASQVESALKKAHGRWLQGLTELEEYKAHLKAARGKWEKESEIGIAQQVSQAVSAAEEKWKKEIETCDKIRVRAKELEEGMFSLQRELELKTEEIPAIVKAELAKARTQWNKEKQEEVLRMQEQNEKDYHSFLQEHRNKINEVLAKAKEDFAKQRKELLDQKEAELKMSLNRKQQEWAVQEAKRIQSDIAQHEDRILVQVELILDDLHKELVRPVSNEPAWSAMWNPVPTSPVQAHLPFKEKLTLCLQKAYKTAVWATLERAKEKWKEKREDLVYGFKHCEDSRMQGGEGETGDQVRPFMYNIGHQVELERMLRKQPPLQETQMDSDSKYKKRNLLFQEDVCCEHCHRQLERKEKECQDLKKKLDKACRHLQLAAKEQEAKSEQLQENEKIVESLMEENSTVKNRLDNLKSAHVPPRSASEGCVSKPCPSCDGKALEEMRSQYLKAAGKIKSDMLRYIHESKERAAEIIKAEVLRERQETARKMRKYYLICLQQLLIDDGKHEGAEKKIISAAGKIATMAKLLETSVRSSPRDKATQSVPSQNTKLFSEVGEPHRNYMPPPGPVPLEGQAPGESLADKTGNPILHRHLPCSLQQRLEAESQPLLTQPLGDSSVATVSAAAFGEDRSTSRGLLQVNSSQKLPSCLSQGKPQDVHPTTCTAEGSESGLACVRLKNPVDTSAPRERSCVQSMKHLKATSEKTQSHEILETPVRDGGTSDWTLLSDTTPYPGQKGSSGSSDQFPSANLYSQAKEDEVVFCRRSGGNQDTLPVMKRPGLNCPEAVNATCTPYSNLDSASPSDSCLNGTGFCSTAGKSYGQLYTRKQRRDVLVFQEDSGFDSPQLHLD